MKRQTDIINKMKFYYTQDSVIKPIGYVLVGCKK